MYVSATAEQQLQWQRGRRGVCSWPRMAHKGNWPENTWTSHQGPTLPVILPRGTIGKMNTLIKTAMCVHRCVCASVRTYARTNQFRDSVNIWQQKCLSLNQSDVLFMMFVCGCVLMLVCIYTFLCACERVCVDICVREGVCMYLYGFMCVRDCLTTPHT